LDENGSNEHIEAYAAGTARDVFKDVSGATAFRVD
jgi:hypothetical protein